ncbi:hypothetical protein GH714_036573 [Hevea brasiliensis]|uniref:Uncharacterized protein n=1 Tax=Hevea brasiliensis TaxID=3981 RepID=A0A6A6L455_HEVBR|nr:hypothetical protein GH714_036573 [Hevea brasiliensis]
MGFVYDVAVEVGIPAIQMQCASACSFWTFLSIPDAVAAHQLPVKVFVYFKLFIPFNCITYESSPMKLIGKEDMDRLIAKVRGMETFLRCRDLPPSQSVLYVMTRDQHMEFWYGLVNSKKKFLWVIRPESVMKQDGDNLGESPEELQAGQRKEDTLSNGHPRKRFWHIRQLVGS